MTEIHGTEASEGRLGAVLRSAGSTQPVKLGRFGPWLATTVELAKDVLTDPRRFDFPTDVSRYALAEERATDTPRRSPRVITPPVSPTQVATGREVFASELAAEAAGIGGEVDVMVALRRPMARSTTAALLPGLDPEVRNRVAEAVLDWIDALGPVIASRFGATRWSRARRRETAARLELDRLLEAAGVEDPPVLATVLAAGIQVPIAAGAWLLAELAHQPELAPACRANPELVPGVVWETVRLCPPTWITARAAVDPTRLGGVDVSAGQLVMVSPLLLGRDPSLVPGPADGAAPLERFSPSRWLQDRVRPGAWLPFGAGPHACPGRNLGLAQLSHLATWATAWEIRPASPVRVNQSRGIFPDPARLSFEPC